MTLFEDVVAIVETGSYLMNSQKTPIMFDPTMMSDTKFYSREFSVKNDITINSCHVDVVNDDCLKVAYRYVEKYGDVCLLNLASNKNPCGSVIYGEGAQEEYISLCSDYYRSLFQFTYNEEKYKKYNISMRENEHYPLDECWGGVFSPNVTFFRERASHAKYRNIAPWKCNIIAVPALNCPECVEKNGQLRISDTVVPIVKNKIRTIFRIALDNSQHNLVLSAWGCGAYKNPPQHIAALFKDILCKEFPHAFANVIFAINGKNNNFEIFHNILCSNY